MRHSRTLETESRPVVEKRKHHRVVVDLPVTCTVGTGEPFAGVAKDISLGGMFVETESALSFGTSLTISLSGVADREIRIPAIVRWRKPQGFGVQFGLVGAYETFVITEIGKRSRA